MFGQTGILEKYEKWLWKRVLVYKIAECEPAAGIATAAADAKDDSFEEDPYYTDCRLKNPNNEYMTDEQIEELLQSDDVDFNSTRPDSDFLIIYGAFQDQQIFMKD